MPHGDVMMATQGKFSGVLNDLIRHDNYWPVCGACGIPFLLFIRVFLNMAAGIITGFRTINVIFSGVPLVPESGGAFQYFVPVGQFASMVFGLLLIICGVVMVCLSPSGSGNVMLLIGFPDSRSVFFISKIRGSAAFCQGM